MVGKFNNNITIQGGGGNGNTPSGGSGGIRVVEITTQEYTVKEEDMGCVFLIKKECTFDFTNINQTAIFFFYHINENRLSPKITCKAKNKKVIEDDFYYPFLSFGFNYQTVMVYNNVVYFKPEDTGPQ